MRIWYLGIALLLCNTANAGNRLMPGEILTNDAYIQSNNSRYHLSMQSDGSLVMYRSDGSIRYRMEKHGTYAVMQHDGNFVEYAGSTPIWASNTAGRCEGCWLEITDRGDLQIKWENPSGSLGYVEWSIGLDPDPSAEWDPQQYPLQNVQTPGSVPTYVPTGDYIPTTFNRNY